MQAVRPSAKCDPPRNTKECRCTSKAQYLNDPSGGHFRPPSYLGGHARSFLFSYYQFRGGKRNLRKDVERRAAVLAESLAGHVEPELEKGSIKKLQGIVERFSNRERLILRTRSADANTLG